MLQVFSWIELRAFAGADWEIVRARIDLECERLERHPDLTPPLVALQLLVSGEDHRHARHPGFDVIAICRAMWRRITLSSREGASTIEQQIVRTITGRYERTLRRKIKEILLATLINANYQKNILPAVYLSIAYYGWRMNGYCQACQRLSLCPGYLTLDEAAALVARLKYPEPKISSDSRKLQIHRRRKHLLGLYCHHFYDGTYEHLNDKTVCCSPPTLGPAQSIS
ncbi:transglycosylase domain-containing protein [bacterium AH-315-B06]|nr:transglycosylase domain-containing protein [bacterium AH-315-B06]